MVKNFNAMEDLNVYTKDFNCYLAGRVKDHTFTAEFPLGYKGQAETALILARSIANTAYDVKPADISVKNLLNEVTVKIPNQGGYHQVKIEKFADNATAEKVAIFLNQMLVAFSQVA